MGNASGADDVAISANKLWFDGAGIVGFNLAAFSATYPEQAGDALRRALAAVASEQIHVSVTDLLPLDQASAAHRELEEGRTVGKVAFEIRPDES
jgi:NADPH2:quinone reductase